MLSVLKELREKSEFIPTESEKESENAEEHNEEANPIAEDDFFMEEWVVCSSSIYFHSKKNSKRRKRFGIDSSIHTNYFIHSNLSSYFIHISHYSITILH